jgi:hypothetical protein
MEHVLPRPVVMPFVGQLHIADGNAFADERVQA